MAVWTFIVGQTKTLAADAESQLQLLKIIEQIPLPRLLFGADSMYDDVPDAQWKSGRNAHDHRFVFYKETPGPMPNYPVQIIFQNDLVIIIGPSELFQMYFYFADEKNFERRDRWLSYAEQLFKALGSDHLVVMTEFEEEELPDSASLKPYLQGPNITHAINEYTSNKTYLREI